MTVEKSDTEHGNGDAAKPARAGLSVMQVATSVLAAASAAVVASFLGVAGTVIGAALASLTTTVSAALYGESLRRTGERLHRLRGERATRHTRTAPRPLAQSTAAAPDARGGKASVGLPGRLDPRRPPARPRSRWTRVAVSAAAVFGLAMALITTVELIGQRPVSALVGASSVRGTTTVGEIAGGDGTRSTGQSRPSQSPSPTAPTASDSSAPAAPGSATSTATSRSTPDGTSSSAPSPGSARDSTSAAPSPAPATEPTPAP